GLCCNRQSQASVSTPLESSPWRLALVAEWVSSWVPSSRCQSVSSLIAFWLPRSTPLRSQSLWNDGYSCRHLAALIRPQQKGPGPNLLHRLTPTHTARLTQSETGTDVWSFRHDGI